MARILVVSRNPAMSMSLAGGEHEVDTCRPALLSRWTEGSEQVDAYILDLGEPDDATAAVEHLRATGRKGPVLLVAGSTGTWAQVEAMPPPGSAVLPLPVTRARLIAALEGLFQAPPTQASLPRTQDGPAPAIRPAPGTPHVATGADEETPPPSSPALDVSAMPDAPPEQAFQSAVPELPAATMPATAEEARLESVAVEAEPESIRLPAYEPRPRPPLPPVSTPPPPLRSTTPPSPATPSEPTTVQVPVGAIAAPMATTVLTLEEGRTVVLPPSRSHAIVQSAAPALGLVEALSSRVGELYSVPETAEVVVLDALERTGAAAASLLVPDGDVWRVAAGSGLRALESRCEMAGDTWLIQMVARASKGMLVEGSDIVRVKMSGAPLASWPHLAAAPVPRVGAILLAARADHAFSEADLTALAVLGEEAAGPLADAVAVRALARLLDEHRNPRDHEASR